MKRAKLSAGVDEVGRGSLAGPVVAAAVISIVHEGEVCVDVIKFPVQVICDKAGEPEWV